MLRAILLGSLVVAGTASADDSGVLRASRASGPFVLSIFTAPEPRHAGRAEVSVLVQSGDTIALDATVELRLRAPDGAEQTISATRGAASHPLFQSALVDLSAPGRWQIEATARHAGAAATVKCDLDVAPAAPPDGLLAHWMALTLPALCVLLFAWRQRLLLGRRRRQRGVRQPPCAATSRSASFGPQVPGS